MIQCKNKIVLVMLSLLLVLSGLSVTAQADDIEDYLIGEIAHLLPVKGDVNVYDFSVVAADSTGDRRVEKLATHQGKVLLLTFWAEHCSLCRLHLKQLAAIQQELGIEKLEIIAINQDRFPHARVKKTLERWGIRNLAAYQDYHNDVATRLKDNPAIRFFGTNPKTLVIGPDGQVRAIANTRKDWSTPEAQAFFEALDKRRL